MNHGCWASIGGVLGNLRPICLLGHVWPSGSGMQALTGDYCGPSSFVIRSRLKDTWRLIVWGVWWNTLASLHGNLLRKIRNNYLGDLGFEPRSQRSMPVRPATTPTCFIRYDNRQLTLYIIKSNILENKRCARFGFEWASDVKTHHRLLHQIAGSVTCGFLSAGSFIGSSENHP